MKKIIIFVCLVIPVAASSQYNSPVITPPGLPLQPLANPTVNKQK